MKRRPLRPGSRALERRTPLTRASRIKARKVSKRFAKLRQPDYKAWIVTLPCLVSGRSPVDPAHVRSRGAGGSDYANLVPLTRALHDELHRIGRRSFERRYAVDLASEAARLAVRYDEQETAA